MIKFEGQISFNLPGTDVGKAPETENKLERVKDALEEEESPELHDGGVDDVHGEACHVSHLLWWNADINVGDTLQWVTARLGLQQIDIATFGSNSPFPPFKA